MRLTPSGDTFDILVLLVIVFFFFWTENGVLIIFCSKEVYLS